MLMVVMLHSWQPWQTVHPHSIQIMIRCGVGSSHIGHQVEAKATSNPGRRGSTTGFCYI